VRNGRLFVTDCQTTNGTLVNGGRLGTRQELRPGDQLQVGPAVFTVSIRSSRTEKVPPAQELEEELAARMLLEVDVPEGPTFENVEATSPLGETAETLSCQDTNADQPALAPGRSEDQPGKAPPVSTAKAAQALLGKYLSRPRSAN
jgi:pSer/pThr/pTyr-binding forkhead associated (FHA) protein